MWIVLKHRTIWHKEFGHQRGPPSILRTCVPENLLHFLTLNHDSINIVKVPSCNKTLNNSLLISQSLFFPLYQRKKKFLETESAKSSAQSRYFTRSPKPSAGRQSCACSGEPPRPSTLLLPLHTPGSMQDACARVLPSPPSPRFDRRLRESSGCPLGLTQKAALRSPVIMAGRPAGKWLVFLSGCRGAVFSPSILLPFCSNKLVTLRVRDVASQSSSSSGFAEPGPASLRSGTGPLRKEPFMTGQRVQTPFPRP